LSIVAGIVGKCGLPTPGRATSSELGAPIGLAFDNHGDLFIADIANNMVEKVTPAGALSVVAGNGKDSITGPSSGSATASALDSPIGLAVDARGNLFIADEPTSVLKVTPAGTLSGAGSIQPVYNKRFGEDLIGELAGVAVDRTDDLFMVDQGNGVVDKLTATGAFSVIAGNTEAGPPTPGLATHSALASPVGIALDAHGNVFIANLGSSTVVKVTPAGVLSVVAGNGKEGRPRPGPAISSPLGAGPNGGPTAVAVDAHGDLFIADQYNEVVDEVNPAGTLSVVAGDGKQGRPTPGPATRSNLSWPRAVAVDSHGNLFIGDGLNCVVEKVTL